MVLSCVLAASVVLAQSAGDVPLPAPLPGARLIETKTVHEPLELKAASADEEAVMAGQRYVRHTYERPDTLTSTAFVHPLRDALFAAGWKLLDVTKLEEVPVHPETVNVAAQYRDAGRNIYARFTLEPDKPYTVNVADLDEEDWIAQLATGCRVRIYSIHFERDRPIIKEFESEPTLRKLAAVIKASATPIRIEGHVDNIGEAGAAARDTLALGRARMVASWLTASGGVPANKISAEGRGRARPVADNDSDLGRALNRRIDIARRDCPR